MSDIIPLPNLLAQLALGGKTAAVRELRAAGGLLNAAVKEVSTVTLDGHKMRDGICVRCRLDAKTLVDFPRACGDGMKVQGEQAKPNAGRTPRKAKPRG